MVCVIWFRAHYKEHFCLINYFELRPVIKTGVIKFRTNQDFLIEHSCILHIRSNLLLL